MDEGAKPVQCPPRRVPVTLNPVLKTELDRMVERGVICPIETPTEWCNQISIHTKDASTTGSVPIADSGRGATRDVNCKSIVKGRLTIGLLAP